MKMKTLITDRKGAFSILYVIVIFIASMIAIAFTDIMIRSYTMDEVQSTMDIAGVSALQTGVDKQKLRVEIFDVDRHMVEANYKNMVTERLDDSERIESFRFIKTDVEVYNSKFGLGQTTKQRPQAIIDSTVIIVVDNSQMFDLIPGSYKRYYDAKDGSYFDVNFLGVNEDGKVELSIRSVSRIVYR